MLSVLLLGSGALTISFSGEVLGLLAGASLGGLGAIVAIRLVRSARNNRRVRLHSAGHAPGDRGSGSVARSA